MTTVLFIHVPPVSVIVSLYAYTCVHLERFARLVLNISNLNKNHQSGAPTIWKQSWNKMHKTHVQLSNIHIQVHIKLGNHWQTSLADIAISHGASKPWAFLQVLECFLASLSWAEEVTLRGEPQGKLEGLRYTNDVLMTKNNQKVSTV